MKKIFFVLTAVFCTGLLAAGDILDISGDIGLGYMNYSMFTTFRSSALKSQLKEGLSSALGEGNLKYDEPKSSDYYNALGLGLSVKVSYFFTNLTVGFPFRQIPTGYDPLSAKLNTAGISNKLTNSVILDWQLGGGFTLFKNRPLNIFLGAALGIGYVRTSRHLPQSFVKTVTDRCRYKVLFYAAYRYCYGYKRYRLFSPAAQQKILPRYRRARKRFYLHDYKGKY